MLSNCVTMLSLNIRLNELVVGRLFTLTFGIGSNLSADDLTLLCFRRETEYRWSHHNLIGRLKFIRLVVNCISNLVGQRKKICFAGKGRSPSVFSRLFPITSWHSLLYRLLRQFSCINCGEFSRSESSSHWVRTVLNLLSSRWHSCVAHMISLSFFCDLFVRDWLLWRFHTNK